MKKQIKYFVFVVFVALFEHFFHLQPVFFNTICPDRLREMDTKSDFV